MHPPETVCSTTKCLCTSVHIDNRRSRNPAVRRCLFAQRSRHCRRLLHGTASPKASFESAGLDPSDCKASASQLAVPLEQLKESRATELRLPPPIPFVLPLTLVLVPSCRFRAKTTRHSAPARWASLTVESSGLIPLGAQRNHLGLRLCFQELRTRPSRSAKRTPRGS